MIRISEHKWWQEHSAKKKEKTEKQVCIKETKRSFEHTGAGKGIEKIAAAQGGNSATAKTSAPTRGVKAIPRGARLLSETQTHI